MRFTFISMWLSLFSGLSSFASQSNRNDFLFDDLTVKKCAYCAWKRALFGKAETEQAFWLLKTTNGYQCGFWASSGVERGRATSAVIPQSAIALFHTHPDDAVSINANDRGMANKIYEEFDQDVVFYILAGHHLGIIDPVTQYENAKHGTSEMWTDGLTKEDRNTACSGIKIGFSE